MVRLKEKYQKEIMPKLREEFGIKNNMAVPKITKIVINVGTGDAKDNPEIIEKVSENLSALSGQKAVATKAKVAVSGFKLSQGAKIGVMVTLRGRRMYDFLDKLISVVFGSANFSKAVFLVTVFSSVTVCAFVPSAIISPTAGTFSNPKIFQSCNLNMINIIFID